MIYRLYYNKLPSYCYSLQSNYTSTTHNMDNKTTRSDSVSSAASGTSPISPTISGRRGSGPLFASLHENKRPNDPRIQARRASLHEQRPAPGIFGKMWNKYVAGYDKHLRPHSGCMQ